MSFEAYARATRYQTTPYAGRYGGHSSAGNYGGGYDKAFPKDVPFPGDMPFDEYYGEVGQVPMAGGSMGSGGGRRAPSTVAASVEARSEWVATSPENLYNSDETDGVVKDQPYTALPPIWGQTHYSNM